MKTTTIAVTLLALPVWAGDVTSLVLNGRSLLQSRIGSVLQFEHRQILSPSNMVDTIVYQNPGATQRWETVYTKPTVGAPLVATLSSYWTNGVLTFQFDNPDESEGIYLEGGNVGAISWNSDGQHWVQAASASYLGVWADPTWNCALHDDVAEVTWWFRAGTVSAEAPFIGCKGALRPGARLSIGPNIPMNGYWHHLGIDRCFGCHDCWLNGWGSPDHTVINSAGNSGPIDPSSGSITVLNYANGDRAAQVTFPVPLGAVASFLRSENLTDWTLLGTAPESSGWVSWMDNNPPGTAFYKVSTP